MVYLIIILILFSLTIYYDANGKKPNDLSIYWGICVLLIVFLGIRYHVGGDTIGYMKIYKTVPPLFDISWNYLYMTSHDLKYGIFWLLTCSFCKIFTDSFTMYQFFHALVVNIVIFSFIKKYGNLKFTNLLFYFCLYFLYFNTEILRESLAVCVFLANFKAFKEKRWVKYYLGVIIAIQFHLSASILLILPLMNFTNKLSYRDILISFSIITIALPLLRNPIIHFSSSLTDDIVLKLKIINYTNYTASIKGIIFALSLKVLFPLLILYIDEKILGIKTDFRVLFLSFIMFSILAIYFTPFSRFVNYIIPVYYLYLTEFLARIYKAKQFRQLRQPIVSIFFIIIFLPNIYVYFKNTSERTEGTRYYRRYIPYYTVFSKKEDDKRERLVRTYNPHDPTYFKEK